MAAPKVSENDSDGKSVENIFSTFCTEDDIVTLKSVKPGYQPLKGFENDYNSKSYEELHHSHNFIISKSVYWSKEDGDIISKKSGSFGSFNFPGKFSQFNFSELIRLKEASFIILNKKIEDYIGDSNVLDISSLNNKTYILW